MKKFKLQSIALVVFLVTSLISCSSDNDSNPTTEQSIFKSAFATEVTGPSTGKVNEELSYLVTFTVENGCGEFNKMTDVNIDKESGYQVEAKYPATCSTDTPQIRRTTYKVKSAVKGTFYLRFAKSETEFITTAVVIN